ncbi:MAG: hypothetical protein ACMUIL_12840 [bacterium]
MVKRGMVYRRRRNADHRRAMCLRLPEVTMLEDLFDDFRLLYDRDDSHVVQTAGAYQRVDFVYLLDEGGPGFAARFFGRNGICDNEFTAYHLF